MRLKGPTFESHYMRYLYWVMVAEVLFFVAVAGAAWEPEEAAEPEALTWLQEECPPAFWRSQTQFTLRSAERLVRRLYDAGALRVTMARVLGEFKGLRVFLPLDPLRRRDLLALVNKRLSECSLAAAEDTGQEAVVLWFCRS